VFAQSSSILPVDLDAQHVVIGADVVIGNAVVLRDVVLMDGAVIGDGANISQSIVAGRVGEGARLVEWCVVGRDGVVAPGAMERGSKIPAV
jgi:NDP-sugar pyrophosphorylase family protein